MSDFWPVLFIVAFFAWYLTYSATRLDRLHHRVETSWANLDGLLQKRAAIAIELARSDNSDPASAMLLMASAHQAREADFRSRSNAESGLSAALGVFLDSDSEFTSAMERELLNELRELDEKIRMAIAMHVESVTRTQFVRRKVINRLFRLAGHAPEPVIYEFEANVL
jgi:hypothetical protein